MMDFTDPAFWVPALIGIVAVILAAVAIWRQVQDRKVAKASLDLLKTMRKEIRLGRTPQTGQQSTAIASQTEARKQEALQWKKLTDIAKGIGWFLDSMGEQDEEE